MENKQTNEQVSEEVREERKVEQADSTASIEQEDETTVLTPVVDEQPTK